MVALADRFASKIEERKGTLTEDEVMFTYSIARLLLDMRSAYNTDIMWYVYDTDTDIMCVGYAQHIIYPCACNIQAVARSSYQSSHSCVNVQHCINDVRERLLPYARKQIIILCPMEGREKLFYCTICVQYAIEAISNALNDPINAPWEINALFLIDTVTLLLLY